MHHVLVGDENVGLSADFKTLGICIQLLLFFSGWCSLRRWVSSTFLPYLFNYYEVHTPARSGGDVTQRDDREAAGANISAFKPPDTLNINGLVIAM